MTDHLIKVSIFAQRAQVHKKLNGPTPASFCLFSSFNQYEDKFSIQFETKMNPGSQIERMVGTDETTELWRPPILSP